MDHKITIRTTKGQPDSLKESVKLFYTLTPVHLDDTTHYSPVGQGLKLFENGAEKSAELSWKEMPVVWTCALNDGDKVRLRKPGWVFPGDKVQISCSSPGGEVSLNKSPNQPRPTVAVANNTPWAQNVCLTLITVDEASYKPIVLYDPVPAGGIIVSSLDLIFQVYAVDASKVVAEIPKPEDLTRPLFTAPLRCSTLPASSSWKLSQDPNGNLKLINDRDPQLGQPSIELGQDLHKIVETTNDNEPQAESPSNQGSIDEIYDKLSLVLKTLDTTQQRLAAFEKTLSDNQSQLSTTQKDLADARHKLALMERAVPTVEAKAAELGASLTHTETSVALVQHQVSTLNGKVPIVEEKLSGMETAFGKSEKRLSAMDLSLNAQRNQLSDLADRQIPQLETKSSQLENSYSLDKLSTIQKSVDLARDHLSTLDRRVLAVETKTDDVILRTPGRLSRVDFSPPNDATAAMREQVANLSHRVPTLEAKADELERLFGETKKDVSVMRKLLRTRFPALESKADTLEKSVRQAQEELSGLQSSLDSSGDRLSSLGMRMTVVEGALRGMGVGLHDTAPAAHSRAQSPLLFPSQPHASRTSTPSPSHEAAFFNREDSDSDLGE